MTLIVTEVSKEGIAMAADSMISFQDEHGITTCQEQWQKLFKVDDVAGTPAGVSYWGNIGDITNTRFDKWLTEKLGEAPRGDLLSFATYLTEQANLAARDKLIAKGKSAGFHVAGFYPWSDGKSRPTFFHIHNGHLTVKATAHSSHLGSPTSKLIAGLNIPTGAKSDGSELKLFLRETQQMGAKVDYTYQIDPRKQFEVHADFPSGSASLEENLAELEAGHLTRNGDHLTDALIEARIGTIPATPSGSPTSTAEVDRDVGTRLGVLIGRMKVVIKKYAAISNAPAVGGKILTLAICPDGTYFDGSNWSK
jgi:hypothetical protein